MLDIDQSIKSIKVTVNPEGVENESKLDIFENTLIKITEKWKEYRKHNIDSEDIDIECIKGILKDLTDKSSNSVINKILKDLNGESYNLELINNHEPNPGPPFVDRLKVRRERNNL